MEKKKQICFPNSLTSAWDSPAFWKNHKLISCQLNAVFSWEMMNWCVNIKSIRTSLILKLGCLSDLRKNKQKRTAGVRVAEQKVSVHPEVLWHKATGPSQDALRRRDISRTAAVGFRVSTSECWTLVKGRAPIWLDTRLLNTGNCIFTSTHYISVQFKCLVCSLPVTQIDWFLLVL